jgi:hypothetical protein
MAEDKQVSFADALNEVAKNLRQQPVLLFTLGALILVSAIGTLALPNLSLVIVAILVLAFVGLLVWVFMEMEKMRSKQKAAEAKQPPPAPLRSVASGEVNIGDENEIDESVTSGEVDATLSDDVHTIGSGPVNIGSGNKLNGPIGSGKVVVNKKK